MQKDSSAQPVPAGNAGTTPLAAADQSSANAVSLDPVSGAVDSAGTKGVPATPRLIASTEARANAGRQDPCSAITGFPLFPRFMKGEAADSEPVVAGGKPDIPPPPPGKEPFVPPLPPGADGPGVQASADSDLGLSEAELPAPPTKPSLADKMKLTAVIGDRAVLAFTDALMRIGHKWPRSVTLGPGEHFESVSVVSVNGDTVTIDEDGDRSVKTIRPVK